MKDELKKYKVVRFFQRRDLDSQTIIDSCPLEEAQEHCQDPETDSNTCTNQESLERTRKFGPWFDGYLEII